MFYEFKRSVFDSFGLGSDRTEKIELPVDFNLDKEDDENFLKPTKYLHGLKINIPGFMPNLYISYPGRISLYCERYSDVELEYKHISEAKDLNAFYSKLKKSAPKLSVFEDKTFNNSQDMNAVMWKLENPKGILYSADICDFDLQSGSRVLTSEDVSIRPDVYTYRNWKDLYNRNNATVKRTLNCYTMVRGRIFKISLRRSRNPTCLRWFKLRNCLNMNWLETEAWRFRKLNGEIS